MTPTPMIPRFLSEASCRAINTEAQALGLWKSGVAIGNGGVDIVSTWRGDVRWARNRISDASDWRDNTISCNYPVNPIVFNQVDTPSLRAMADVAQRETRDFPVDRRGQDARVVWMDPAPLYPQPHIWSECTYTQTADTRETVAVQLIASAEQAGMLSAGYLSAEARGTSLYSDFGQFLYAPQTLAQCSMTVRDPQGNGSGWAGISSYDWGRIDAPHLAAIALEKCLRSRNPVKIEPGRYTLIMEPQATFELVQVIFRDVVHPRFIERQPAEFVSPIDHPFKRKHSVVRSPTADGAGKEFSLTRIGEKLLDERISMTFDPSDAELGVLPWTMAGDPYVPVTWFDQGVLTTMEYNRDYARDVLREPTGKPNSKAFRMSGGTDTIDDMIASTTRGLLVTRFWNVKVIDYGSMLCTGVTRDGLWLIEHGKMSHPVNNLKFVESPMFAFNNVEQLGVPVPIFSPGIPAVVPPVKVRDFSFTALIDAV